MWLSRFIVSIPVVLLAATTVAAQNPPSPPVPPQGGAPAAQPPAVPVAAASSFATEEVRFPGRYIGKRWLASPAGLEGPSRITVTYGQPHVRGREIVGKLVPYDSVWRLGANLATVLHTDLDITLGGTRLQPGSYSLYALPTKSGWQLIINRQTGQWGTQYDRSQDIARIPLRRRTVAEPIESLSMYLVPTRDPKEPAGTMPHGTFKIIWEKTELSTDWAVVP